MALTGSEVADPLTDENNSDHTKPDQPGRITRWVRADPIRAAVAALIALQLAWRADIASRGYLTEDDFTLAARAVGSDLTPSFLFEHVSNHLAPGVMLATWLIVRIAGLEYGPYLVLLLVGQAAVSTAFYRLLRRLMKPGWALLIPLCVFLFTPITLDLTAFWFTGALILPMQLAMVLAMGAQVKYVRTGRARHLVTLALSVVFGLLFFEKSLLIGPLLFLLTACLLVDGGVFVSIARTIRLYWPSWLVLSAVSAVYVVLYQAGAESSLRTPTSPGEVGVFVRDLVGATLIPGLLGGPWQWLDAGDGAPVAAPDDFRRWLAWGVFLALVAFTVALRRSAARAWVLLATYTALAGGIVAAGRLGGGAFSAVAGWAPRYVSDVALVAAMCIGVALFGLTDNEDTNERRRTWPATLRHPEAMAFAMILAIVGLATLGVGAALSGARFSDNWSVKQGRDYLRNAQADLARASADTVFFDQPVPVEVLSPIFAPYNLQSEFFKPLVPGPVFVTETESPSMFDQSGHIHTAKVDGIGTWPGSVPGCGHKLSDGVTARLPLVKPAFAWTWFVRVGYLSTGKSTAVLRLGEATRQFDINRGLHQIYFPITGAGDAVELTANNPAVTVCVDQVTVGNLVPRTS